MAKPIKPNYALVLQALKGRKMTFRELADSLARSGVLFEENSLRYTLNCMEKEGYNIRQSIIPSARGEKPRKSSSVKGKYLKEPQKTRFAALKRRRF